jgi:hypothetical protein
MKRVSVGQKWCNEDAMSGRFFAEVIEIAEEGRQGTVVITDCRGNVLDTFSETAAKFQTANEWKLIEEIRTIRHYSCIVNAAGPRK